MSRPILLISEDLMKPINKGKKNIIAIKNELEKANSSIVQKGLFTYVYAIFETTLNDILKYILTKLPYKIKTQEFKYSKELVLSIFDSTELINIEVEKMVQSLSYKNLNAYLEEFISITSIEPFDESLINQLIERKATRNLLIHNDLIFNGIYDEAAGPLKRSPNYNGYLSFDLLYINETVHYIEQVFIHIEKSLTNRFSQYTKVNALKNLWNYLFHSPVLRFDDYWEYDDQRIISLKKNHVKRMLDNLSSSERKLLAIWLIHFNPQLCSIFVPEDHSIYTSSLKQSEKLKYLTSLIINDPDLFKLH